MIDDNEKLVPLSRVTERIPVTLATAYRYLQRGLEGVRIAGRYYTSEEAIQRFIRSQNPDRVQSPAVAHGRTEVDRALDAAGVV